MSVVYFKSLGDTGLWVVRGILLFRFLSLLYPNYIILSRVKCSFIPLVCSARVCFASFRWSKEKQCCSSLLSCQHRQLTSQRYHVDTLCAQQLHFVASQLLTVGVESRPSYNNVVVTLIKKFYLLRNIVGANYKKMDQLPSK